MPIKPENKARYGKDWPAVRKRILQREEYRCKRCRAPDRERIARGAGRHAGTYMTADAQLYDAETGELLAEQHRHSDYELDHMVLIVLTIAHLDQIPEHNDDDNLAALCQRCHLQHDREPSAAKAWLTRHLSRGDDMFGFEGDQR
jgi:5-methylcytosine-specific restriction endonuclease McrA